VTWKAKVAFDHENNPHRVKIDMTVWALSLRALGAWLPAEPDIMEPDIIRELREIIKAVGT
jgi:hypothetical protein